MRWRGSRQSSNVEDRRGRRVAAGAGLGGAGLVIVLIVMLLGGDPGQVLQQLDGSGAPADAAVDPDAPQATDEAYQFLTAILGMTEDVWGELFAASGSRYHPPTMVLFTGAVQSACGYNTAATGPFYCPPDQKLYLDTGFFDDLARLGGPGDFAQAYVIGHEVGHHVQNLVGTNTRVREAQQRARSQAEANRQQVMMELQADCYAGVWAHHANRRRQVLEPGDVDEGLAAAAAIGDDRLQRGAGQVVSPESFTHGSSAERQRWLRRGLDTGDVDACDTFAGG
jgi:predicted metalloprotease